MQEQRIQVESPMTPQLIPRTFSYQKQTSSDPEHVSRQRREKVYVKSTKIFNEELPIGILKMIFDDQVLDYEDVLECRLVSRY